MTEIALGPAEADVFSGVRARQRIPVLVLLSALILLALIACALFGKLLAPHDPAEQDLLLGATGPSGAHWLGTDDLGRDMLSRVVASARTAFFGPALIAVGAMAIGSSLGLLAGYRGGIVDALLMRWVDLMYAFPGFLVTIIVIGVFGGGYYIAVLVLMLLTSPFDIRIVRGATLEQRPRPYVEAAQALGLSSRRIMFRHIWPNVLPLIVANTFLAFAGALVTLSALSFLGIGARPGAADWGRMLAENQPLLLVNSMAVLGPGLMIVLTAASTNLLGDFLFEKLSDRGRAR